MRRKRRVVIELGFVLENSRAGILENSRNFQENSRSRELEIFREFTNPKLEAELIFAANDLS